MITLNVKRFIALQTQVNNQIDQYGEADTQTAGELEVLGDQLTGTEIAILCSYYEGDDVEDMEMEETVELV
jgi:hypothetical protein